MAPSTPVAPVATLRGEQATPVNDAQEQAMEVHLAANEPIHRDRGRQGQADFEAASCWCWGLRRSSLTFSL